MLYPADKYYYLTQSGCLSDPSLNDKEDYLNVIVRFFEYVLMSLLAKGRYLTIQLWIDLCILPKISTYF